MAVHFKYRFGKERVIAPLEKQLNKVGEALFALHIKLFKGESHCLLGKELKLALITGAEVRRNFKLFKVLAHYPCAKGIYCAYFRRGEKQLLLYQVLV